MSQATPLPAARTTDQKRPLSAAPAGGRRPATARLAHLLGIAPASSLARRFLLASLLLLVGGGLVIGWWIGGMLERSIVDRTASVTGLYVQSFIEPHLETLTSGDWLTASEIAALDELLTDTSFSERIVALKVWRPDGVVAYSPDHQLIGQQFELSEGLREALTGIVVAEMSSLDADENVNELALGFERLLEMYLPVRERGGDRITAVAEFYELPTDIEQQVGDARLQSWLLVAAAVTFAYLLLYGIVRQGSDTITRQQVALEGQVSELSRLLDQNERLRQRVRVAAERTTTLSERNLRRISSDLHDGPGQMLALAMLRLDRLRSTAGPAVQEADQLQAVLSDALRDMRAIAAGLRLPELGVLSTADVVRRAVDDHTRRTAVAVALDIGEPLAEAPLPTKIALFRAIQELLSNATRHGDGHSVSVSVEAQEGSLELAVADRGPGFDEARVGEEGHLGLAGVREQAELLGGTFSIDSQAEGGARVSVRWPL
jgi:signal transduction histidine kinase